MSQPTTTANRLPLPTSLVESNRRAAAEHVDGEALLAQIAAKITEALNDGDFISTKSLAAWLKIGRDQVIAALDEIEAAGIKLTRVRGQSGGAQLVEAA